MTRSHNNVAPKNESLSSFSYLTGNSTIPKPKAIWVKDQRGEHLSSVDEIEKECKFTWTEDVIAFTTTPITGDCLPATESAVRQRKGLAEKTEGEELVSTLS